MMVERISLEPIDQIAIVGLGLIGGSIAKDIHARRPDIRLFASNMDAQQMQLAVHEGVVSDLKDSSPLGNTACLSVIATPLEKVEGVARELKAGAEEVDGPTKHYVLDVSSVKTEVTAMFKELTSDKIEFISTHPMAGTEFAGYNHSRKDLFQAKPWMICPHQNNTEAGLDLVGRFVRVLGGVNRVIDAETHDRQVAVVSHSIIMLSNLIFDYVAENHPEALEFAGDGFTSTTRLASGNPDLHAAILKNNTDLTMRTLEEFNDYLTSKLTNKTITEDLFHKNVERRNKWLRRKSKPGATFKD